MTCISSEQYDALTGLKLHAWNVYWNKVKPDWEFYAEMLDNLKVPWIAQNWTSCLMEKRENGFSTLSTLLKKHNIHVLPHSNEHDIARYQNFKDLLDKMPHAIHKGKEEVFEHVDDYYAHDYRIMIEGDSFQEIRQDNTHLIQDFSKYFAAYDVKIKELSHRGEWNNEPTLMLQVLCKVSL